MKALTYDPAATAPAIRYALELIAEDFPIKPAPAGKGMLTFSLAGSGPRFEFRGGKAVVSGPTLPQLLRALATLRGYMETVEVPAVHEETPRLDTLGLMLDCSRDAVATPATVKLFLRRLALMGINLFMLYTEDTYEVPEEPHIGYLRGRYTRAELRELDGYAATLGIEMIPCIQTLAHLAQMLRWWKRYGDVKGSGDFLYVGQPQTYALIEKMIAAASAPYRSKRIHIGMDEAHGIGHGRYPAIPGERSEFDIMIEHLRRVVEITHRRGLRPMIWCDMFFTLADSTPGSAEDRAQTLAEVGKRIPPEIEMVYWNYYEQDPAFYAEKFDAVRGMGKEPIFAPGLWTDYVFWAHFTHARIDTDAGMIACKERHVREAFTTLWGDDGGSCDPLSALTGLQHFAEHGYRDAERVSDADLHRQFFGSTGLSFEAWDAGRLIDDLPTLSPTLREWADHLGKAMPPAVADLMDERGQNVFGHNPSVFLLWQDPLLGLYDYHIRGLPLAEEYRGVTARLAEAMKAGPVEKRRLAFVHELSRALELKAELGLWLREAYLARDRDRLRELAEKIIPETIRRVGRAHEAHRRKWMETYKPQGWEVIDVRYAGLLGRLRSAQLRVRDFLAARVEAIPELDEERLEIADFPKGRVGYGGPRYRSIISPSVIA